VPLIRDNTAQGETLVTPDLTVWTNSKVPTLFNGDFEAGNMDNGNRVYLLARKDSTPGWDYHADPIIGRQLQLSVTSPHIEAYQPTGSTTRNHVAELSSMVDRQLVHNRFYLPAEAASIKFDYFVKDVETGVGGVIRHPELSLLFRVDGTEYLLGQFVLPETASQGTPTSPAQFQTRNFVIDPSLNRQVGELIFRLSIPDGQPAWQSGMARVWIDNVRFGSIGSPIQTDTAGPQAGGSTATLDLTTLASVLDASRLVWHHMVEAPDRVGGLSFGNVGIPAAFADVEPEDLREDWPTRGSQGGLNDQSYLVNGGSSLAFPWQNQTTVFSGIFPLVEGVADGTAVAHQIGWHGDPAAAAHRHTIQTQDNTGLIQGQLVGLSGAVINEYGILQPPVGDSGALVDERAVTVTNGDVSSDPSPSGSSGAVADLEVLKLQHLTLEPLVEVNASLREGNRVEVATLFHASELGHDQYNQNILQHTSSFGTPTLAPDQNLVNSSGSFGTGFVGLTADQLALLNQATITIADLAEGYLALTNGTTITLDRDAAGHGWFIDSTPFTHEEFTLSAVSHQLSADPNGPAAGRMDLLTVLMHELGHVMGLGHISSAVDGTRLMAGSIDPGIRRLPSTLDLGEPSHQPSAISDQPSDSHTWSPYLAHYTGTSSGEQTPAPVMNPASLVQAAHAPTHVGIFNSNFANSDQQSATYGWDQSGAVTIANGQAVLSEDSNVISTLSQTFTLPAGSTHLRFTLVDVNLVRTGTGTGSAGASPQDAFEVAFLESSTLTPLAGVTAGLTQTDSLFNLQQDGTVRFSNRVSLSTGTLSGSTLDLTQPVIVDIDLTGIATGAGGRLSFDLLGFGDRTSTIVLDNVLLTDGQPTAAPVAVNDSYSVAEGSTRLVPLASGLLLNDTDADTVSTGLSALLVTGPQYGTLSLNADGSFSYVHNGSETITDSFTYRVSDGINVSNVATVSLTITPTNDAPSIAAIAPQTVEQGRTLTVTVIATDPDDSNISPESSALTFSLQPHSLTGISIDPTSGVLTWAVPRTQTVGLYTIAVQVTDAGTPALSG
jgi:VCBS repeat-containing protein